MHGSRKTELFLIGMVLLSGACGGTTKPVNPEPLPEIAPVSAPDPAGSTPDAAAGATADTRERFVLIEQRIHFEYNESSLTAAARATLDAKAVALRAEPSIRIRIEGHADERGSDEYNLVLSNQRALAAKRHLMGLGIDGARIDVTGFGEESPLDPAENETAWALNRRAEFRILAGGPS